jgi:2-polyprenyl-3-methyl-5-hydroxy-6-metoxy-1,4-benzoquinol methylase
VNITTLTQGDITFWDRFAPWYEKWLMHGEYHKVILRELECIIEKEWSVLDIGAGTGVLSIPMASFGCSVTALEPSSGMITIFRSKLDVLSISNIDIQKGKWEELSNQGSQTYDLIVACNSLHLVHEGFITAMTKVFQFRPLNVCLITEINNDYFIDFKEIDSVQNEYNFLFIKTCSVDSSFCFKDMNEVNEFQDITGSKIDIQMKQDTPVQIDKTDIAILCWERKS